MNLEIFPMDVQKCTMEVESFGYDMRNLIFEWQKTDPIQLKGTLQLPQFTIKGYRIRKCTKVYNTGSFTCLLGELILKREMGYYLIQVVMRNYYQSSHFTLLSPDVCTFMFDCCLELGIVLD